MSDTLYAGRYTIRRGKDRRHLQSRHRRPGGDVRNRTAHAEQILKWFAEGYPVLVSGENQTIQAYAVAFPYRSRPCYDGVREFSVYVAREGRGKGFGKAALGALIDDAKARGWWKLLSRIFPENMSSRKLCAALGFREVGIYEKHGRLDGQWRDTVIVEKLLI